MLELNINGKASDLVNKYIVEPLGLKETYLVVPKDKIVKVTGTPNANLGMVNDPSALAVGGYSGHAGIIASNNDLIKLGREFMNGKIFLTLILNMTILCRMKKTVLKLA